MGFPAFDEYKCVIGYFTNLTRAIKIDQYTSSDQMKDNFDRTDQAKAALMLTKAIECNSKAVYCIKNYDSIHDLIENASAEFSAKLKAV